MTLQEVTDVASILVGKQIDVALAKIYLTEGLRLVTTQYPTACPVKCIRIVCDEAEKIYPMPHHLGIYKIYRNKQLYMEYRLDDTGICFSHEGDYQVYYYSAFSGELSETESIPVAVEYDSELCKYVAFSVLRADDPSNRVADRLIDEFYDNCAAIHKSISARLKRKPKPLEAPEWR